MMPALTRQFSASVDWRNQVVTKTSVTFVRLHTFFSVIGNLKINGNMLHAFRQVVLVAEIPVTVQPLVARKCSGRWRPTMPDTPAMSAWRSIAVDHSSLTRHFARRKDCRHGLLLCSYGVGARPTR